MKRQGFDSPITQFFFCPELFCSFPKNNLKSRHKEIDDYVTTFADIYGRKPLEDELLENFKCFAFNIRTMDVSFIYSNFVILPPLPPPALI